MGEGRRIVSRAQARKLVELAARHEIQGHGGLSGASVVAEMLKRSAPLRSLPEHVADLRHGDG